LGIRPALIERSIEEIAAEILALTKLKVVSIHRMAHVLRVAAGIRTEGRSSAD
jgi:hypothetical protein